MDHIQCPALADMSIGDLNQRYRDSFVLYGDQFVYVDYFDHWSDEDIGIRYQPPGLDPIWEPFDWEAVNTARPPSKWYNINIKGKLYAMNLAYPTSRQWTRGLGPRTCFLTPANGNIPRWSHTQVLPQVLTQWDDDPRNPVDLTKPYTIARPYLLVTQHPYEPGKYEVLLRT